MMFTIAVVAIPYGSDELVLELHGPLRSEGRANELADLMNARLAPINQEQGDFGVQFYAGVIGVRPVKIKHAVTAAKALLTELTEQYEDNDPTEDEEWEDIRRGYRPQEIVSSQLLNAEPG